MVDALSGDRARLMVNEVVTCVGLQRIYINQGVISRVAYS